MHHVMLDLETYGVRPGSIVRSIGAVEFEIDGTTGDRFYRNIEQRSCEVAGLTIDPETKAWWATQPGDVQALLKKDPRPLREVAADFWHWFRGVGGDRVRMWSHGASFDGPIWQAAVEAAGGAVPWAHWNTRDTRTLYDIALFDVRDMERDSKAHSALDDCLFQIKCVAAAYQRINLKGSDYLKAIKPRTPPEEDVFA
jgi:hypothetical protein